MLLTPDTPFSTTRLTRHDSVLAFVLFAALLLATSSFFVVFAFAALFAGLLLSIALHYWNGEPAGSPYPHSQPAAINIAAVHIGGDTGGLIFVLGSVAILALGIPSLRWFLIASALVAAAIAMVRVWIQGHRTRRIPSLLRGIAAFF